MAKPMAARGVTMLASCPWCQGLFDATRTGRQFCPKCGAEIDVPAPPEPSAPPQGQVPPPEAGAAPGGQQPPPAPGAPGGQPPPPPPPGAPPPWPPPPQAWQPPYAAGAPALLPAPWERMKELGFWKAFSETWTGACLRPTQFFQSLAPYSMGPAFLYALLVGAVGGLFTTVWYRVTGLSAFLGDGHGLLGAEVVANVMGQAAAIWIYAAVVHVGCMLFGCASQGFSATFRTVAYASGPAVLGILPGGAFFAGIWSMVLAIVGIRWTQRTTGTRAALAVLLLPLILFGTMIAFVFAVLFVAFGGAWTT